MRKWPGRVSESVSSSIGSNLHDRMGQGSSAVGGGGPHDLTKVLLTDDYFSDANPRSMRRLMNVLYVMGRLLKAFQGPRLNAVAACLMHRRRVGATKLRTYILCTRML